MRKGYMLTPEHLKQLFNAFDPKQGVWTPTTPQFYVKRPDAPLLQLQQKLAISDNPLAFLVTGHRGSGKSWALADFARQQHPHFDPIWLDAENSSDLLTLSAAELVFMIGIAVYKIANKTEYPIDSALLMNLQHSVETVIREQTENKSFTLDIAKLIDGVVAVGLVATEPTGIWNSVKTTSAAVMKGLGLQLGAGGKTTQKIEIRPKVADIAACTHSILAEMERLTGQRLLLIIDGLDKMDREQAKALFSDIDLLSSLPCHVIYTAPILLYYSPDLQSARQHFETIELPNLKIHQRGETTLNPEVAEWFKQVFDQRLGMQRSDVCEEQALEELIQMSGGVLREFVALVREAFAHCQAGSVVDLPTAQQAALNIQRKYAGGINTETKQELQRVMQEQLHSGSSTADRLLQNLYILSYLNHELWYDVHPLVKPLIAA